jgi:hypothetical protein
MKVNSLLLISVLTISATCVARGLELYSPPANGLVGWWRGEANGADNTGQNNGVLVGGIVFSAGFSGSGFSISETAGHVVVPASPSLNVGSSSGFTIGAWINPATVAIGRPIVEWAVPGGYGVHLFTWNSGAVYGSIVSTGGPYNVLESAPGLIGAGQFQHVALRYDKGSGLGSLFVNGAVVAEANMGNFTPRTDTDMRIGFRPATSPFGPLPFLGGIDEVTLYNRALSSEEMLELAVVPEPGIGTLLLLGIGAFKLRRRS